MKIASIFKTYSIRSDWNQLPKNPTVLGRKLTPPTLAHLWVDVETLVSCKQSGGSSGVACNIHPIPSSNNLFFLLEATNKLTNPYSHAREKNIDKICCTFDMIGIFGCWTLRPRTQDFPSKHWFRPATSAVENKRNVSAAAPSSPIGSMYYIFTYTWLILMVNAGKY